MRVRFLQPTSSKRIGGIEHALVGLRSALERQGVEVVFGGNPYDFNAVHHFHGLWNPGYIGLANKLSRKRRPYVVSPHGMLEPWAFNHRSWKKAPYFHLFEKRFLEASNALIVTSHMERRNILSKVDRVRVEVIPLGCHEPRESGYYGARERLRWMSGEKYILFLSRIDPKKGLDLLLLSMASEGLDWRGWHLIIVGGGEERYVRGLKDQAA